MSYDNWLGVTATITSCDWEDSPSQSSRSLFAGYFTISFSYAVDGNHYIGKFHSAYEWENDKEVPILYNPQNPIESCVCDEDESRTIPVLECALELLIGLYS